MSTACSQMVNPKPNGGRLPAPVVIHTLNVTLRYAICCDSYPPMTFLCILRGDTLTERDLPAWRAVTEMCQRCKVACGRWT